MDPTDVDLAWLRLALARGVGPVTAKKLVERLGDPIRATEAAPAELRRVLGSARAARLHDALRQVQPGAVLRRAEDLGQRVLTPVSPDWPRAAFAALPTPPPVLFLRGRLPPSERPAVAIVGTREASHFGCRFARELAENLAREGLWVVSGLAVGIDGAAHAGALAAGTSGTVGVLGCGVDVAYPAAHLELKEEMAKTGGVVSEHPPGVEPQPGLFPQRNRIVAALASAVVVVEAPPRSGALLTAQRGLEMGREILAVPGTAGSNAWRGSHRLIRSGAAGLCDGVGDVLAALGLDRAQEKDATVSRDPRPPPASGAPLAVWGVIDESEVVGTDELCRRTGLDAEAVLTALARLELDGRVARVPGLGVRRL